MAAILRACDCLELFVTTTNGDASRAIELAEHVKLFFKDYYNECN